MKSALWQRLNGLEELISGAGGISGLRAPAGAALFEAFGTIGYRLMIFPAMLMVDPVEAANMSHVWVAGVMILAVLMAGEKLSLRHYLGVSCLVGGVVVMGWDGLAAGHALALAGGLIWACYLGQVAYVEGTGRKARCIGQVAGGGVLIFLSFLVERPWGISSADVLWLVCMVLASRAALVLWKYSEKYGESRKAKIGVLFVPVGTALWVWVVGGADLTVSGMAGLVAVTAAGLIVSPHVFKGEKKARCAGGADRLS